MKKQARNQRPMVSRSLGGWVGTGLMVAATAVVSPAATAATLSAWQFDPATRQFTVTLPNGVAPVLLVETEPARIILEIPQTQLGQVETEQSYDGAVRSVRLSPGAGDTLRVVLELAPDTILDSNQVQLTSMPAADQTRWVLTPLIAETSTVANDPAASQPTHAAPSANDNPEDRGAVSSLPLDTPTGADDPLLSPPPAQETTPETVVSPTPATQTGMVVELPVIPAAEAGLGFPEVGQGRLSTTAANLMLPTDVAGLENLPETLPIDPFSIGLSNTEQVTVPGLDELDATVGPGIAAAQESAPQESALPDTLGSTGTEPASQPVAIAPDAATSGTSLTTAPSNAPRESGPGSSTISREDRPQTAPDQAGIAISPAPAEEPATEVEAAVTEADAVDLAVVPAEPPPEPSTAGAVASVEGSEPMENEAVEPAAPSAEAVAIAPANRAVEATPSQAAAPDASATAGVAPITAAPPRVANQTGTDAALSASPPEASRSITAPADSLPSPQANSVAIPAETSASATGAEAPASRDVLVVPELPATTSTATVAPPHTPASPELIVAASEPINFGQPLPETGNTAINGTPDNLVPIPHNQQVPPDILIAAGTVLQLRYPGNEPLVLDAGTDLKEVLVLETEIRDPITQGILAPRGSQLIGQFEPNGTNQHWISEMLIVPAGQRVPLASTSEYLVGTPQVNGGQVATGAGAGALALALLTSFSGIGLLGGAVVGATAMVGTSPQQVVIEPNQIIMVQVTEPVPRAMPIAAGPDLSREWGTGEWGR